MAAARDFGRLVVATAMTLAPLTITAQDDLPPRVGRISGTVRDSAGRVPPRTWVRITVVVSPSLGYGFGGEVDSTGAYDVDSVPAGRHDVSVACAKATFASALLARESVDFGPQAVRRDWVVGTSDCDPRPLRRITRVFAGHYTFGFEMSRFVPCDHDSLFIPSDSVPPGGGVWVNWSTRSSVPRKWPRAPRDTWGNTTLFVRWRGTATGPAFFGHMGVSRFQFSVDSVLEMRKPRRDDCR